MDSCSFRVRTALYQRETMIKETEPFKDTAGDSTAEVGAGAPTEVGHESLEGEREKRRPERGKIYAGSLRGDFIAELEPKVK